jgi:microsomal epoxide hydrolase
MSVERFVVDVPKATLDDLRERLARTRWPEGVSENDWDHGTSTAYLRGFVEHWLQVFDWREQESALNRLSHFRAEVGGLAIHFIHERGRGERPLPLLLTHGYPDSFCRFLKVIPKLADPERHGGDPDDAFDVVVPSLPGFGFSDRPTKPGTTFQVGSLWHELMTKVLGYPRFAAHGGDWGSTVTEQLARSHADSIHGIHLTDVPFWHLLRPVKDPSRAEKKFLDASQAWQTKEGAYALIQGTRPRSLARGLQDSPAGLAAWILDKFHAWSDCHGDLETRFTKDELLTNVMVYWITGTIESSFLPYYDFMNGGPATWAAEAFKEWMGSTERVPAGFAIFPKDISHPPRDWAERFFDVRRWTEMPSGGHFAAMEEPERFVDEIRAFFRPLRRPML